MRWGIYRVLMAADLSPPGTGTRDPRISPLSLTDRFSSWQYGEGNCLEKVCILISRPISTYLLPPIQRDARYSYASLELRASCGVPI
jgi:hypothetical protein